MKVRTLITLSTAALGAVGAWLALATSPAFAGLTHRLEYTITGTNPPSEEFGYLAGVAVEPSTGRIWIADTGPTPDVVDRFSSSGTYEGVQLTEAGTSTTPFPFGRVFSIASRPGGGVLVYDSTNKVVDEFGADGKYEAQISGTSTPQGSFQIVEGMADAGGALWIGNSETKRINRKTVTTFAVVDKYNSSTGAYENVQVTEAASKPLGFLSGMGLTASDSLLVEDSEHDVIDEFSLSGPLPSYEQQIAGTGTPTGSFGRVSAIAVAPVSGRIAVGDATNHVVDELSSSGAYEGQVVLPEKNGNAAGVAITGVAYRSDDSLVVVDSTNNMVDVFGPPIHTPTAKTGTAITQSTTATLSGEVNPEGVDASAFFEYGPCETPSTCASSPYGQTAAALVEGTQSSDIGNGLAYVKVQAKLEGLQPNKAYHYRLVGQNENGEDSGAEATLTTFPAKPAIEAQQALFVTPTTAEFAGVVNAENEPTTMKFEYGPCADPQSCATSGYPYATTTTSVGEGFGGVALYSEVEALAPASTYHYRVFAENGTGVTESAEGTFTTPAQPQTEMPPAPGAPQALTVTPTAVGPGAATLNGQVSPNGGATSYRFELALGDDPAAVYVVAALGQLGAGSEPASVSVDASDLQPGTSYSYRLTATNAYGSSTSAATVFTTVGFPAAFTQPVAPALLAVPNFPVVKISPVKARSKPSCRAKAKRIKKAKRRRAALRRCRRAKRRRT